MAGKEVREYTNLSDPKDRKWGKGKDKIDDEDITFQRMVAKIGQQPQTRLEALKENFHMVKLKRCLGDVDFYWHKLWNAIGLMQMQEVAGERGGYLHGRGALDSDDLLYLKEQMEAEEDAERLLRRTEKRAFAAFKKAASLVDSSPAPLPLPLRVEPKPKSGIRQQDLLKNIIGIKPKRQKVSSPSSLQSDRPTESLSGGVSSTGDAEGQLGKNISHSTPSKTQKNACLAANVAMHKQQEQPGCEDTSMKTSGDEANQKAEDTVKSLLGLAYESSDDE